MYSARMRLLPFSWFSMKLGVINSFLIVCFTIVQKKKKYRILTKISLKGYKTIIMEKCLTLTINTREKIGSTSMVTIGKNQVNLTNVVLSGTCLRFLDEV